MDTRTAQTGKWHHRVTHDSSAPASVEDAEAGLHIIHFAVQFYLKIMHILILLVGNMYTCIIH